MTQWIQNAISSLKTIHHLPWERLGEQWSQVHAVFMQDPIYAAMDAKSRSRYRKENSSIARIYGTKEETAAKTILSLCKAAKPNSIKAHCGWYLIDDGFPSLLLQLQSDRATPRKRLSGFVRRHAPGMERLFSWLAFFLLMTFCWQTQLSMLIWLPFSLFFVLIVQQLLHSLILRKTASGFLPRMQMDQLTASTRTLVVCPAVLTSASDAISAVKKLSILHEANPDKHLHFLLMGDFTDNLSVSATADAEITQAASSAIQALCDDTQHPFFYLQRERVSTSDTAIWHSRDRRLGSVMTALKLIQGMPVEDTFVCSTIDPDALKGQYRYVILLSTDTQMPPGSMLRMAGSMMHPLAKRQKLDHQMRGLSIIQPRMETSLHTITTPLGEMLHPANTPECKTFCGTGIIDPPAFLEAANQAFAPGFILGHELLLSEIAGCACTDDIVLYTRRAQTLKAFLSGLHRRIRGEWQLLPVLLPISSRHSAQIRLGMRGRRAIWHVLLRSLFSPVRLCLLLYALLTGSIWLWAAAILLPLFTCRNALSFSALKNWLLHTALLPCEAFVTLDAVFRALYRLFISRKHLLEEDAAHPLAKPAAKPSLLLFTLSLSFAGACAAITLVPVSFRIGCWITALLWTSFAFGMPFLHQEYSEGQKPTSYMREVLLRLARQTFSFFETSVTPATSYLPPESLQLDPAKGLSQCSTPADIGFYLCSLIAAEKLQLLKPDELHERINATLHTLEILPKWHGLFYSGYHTHTLKPIRLDSISSSDCGILAVSLLTCAQGVRVLLPKLDPSAAETAKRLDQLVQTMQLERLYDAEADLFHTGVNPLTERLWDDRLDLLAGESRLLSFAAIALGRVPLAHWDRLKRSCTHRHALLSRFGSLAEYLTPVLFQPLIRKTLLDVSTRSALDVQQKHRNAGAFGVSQSGCYAFDPELNYHFRPFGVPELSLRADIQDNVLAPYASILSLPVDLKAAFRSLLRMEILGLQGPMGLFEAADFDPSRTEGEAMRIVRSHRSAHQGMILCSICNALEQNYIASLFSMLPRMQAFQFLLEDPPSSRRSPVRRALKNPPEDQTEPPQRFERQAHSLHFPIDAHLLSGAGTAWIIDAQGGGKLVHHGIPISHFEESCHVPSGMRLYLRDSQSGAFWLPTDPYLVDSVRFETSEVIFTHVRFGIACELRMWVDPLDGSAVHQIVLENRAASERMMEVCSYLEPALQNHGANVCMHMERLGKSGIAASMPPLGADDSGFTLWHMLQTDAELSLTRLQTDRFAFLGRGRSFHAPRALEHAISAVADSLGDRMEPCLSIRGQFLLPAGERIVLHFVTRMANAHEKSSSFTERFATEELFLRSRAAATTRGVVNARFHHLPAAEQASLSRLTGALLYDGQSFQNHASPLPVSEMQKRFGISGERPLLLLECAGGISQALLSLLIKGHMLFQENGFPFDLAITAKGKRRLATLMEEIESLFAQNRSVKQGVFIIRQPDEAETGLLHSCARLVLQDTEPLEKQLDALSCSVRGEAIFTCRAANAAQSRLPEAEPVLFFNGFGGFTPTEGNYQIDLAPGMQTPASWRNPLCGENFGTLADESGLLFSYASKRLMRTTRNAVSSRGDETVYLQDTDQRLLWSLTRQPLGHGMPIRVTHAPGETVYESCVHGIYSRMHCFTDAEKPMGIRIIQLKNEDTQSRMLKVVHSCIFASGVHLRCEPDCVCGPDAAAEGWLWFGGIGSCSSSAMSAGVFQGLWSNAPFALTALEQLPVGDGNACAITFEVSLAPGESCSFATTITYGDTPDAAEEAVSMLRAQGASQRLRLLRQHWADYLSVIQFDLPDQALSILLSRWLPCQIRNALLWRHTWFDPSISTAIPACGPLDLPSLSHAQTQEEHVPLFEQAIRMSPIVRTASRQLAMRHRSEPYLFLSSCHDRDSWYDESAAWYFSVFLHQILGLHKSGETLRFCPVVPHKWEALRTTLRYGASTYHLHATRQCLSPTSDGEALPDGMLHLVDDGRIHEAFFPLR